MGDHSASADRPFQYVSDGAGADGSREIPYSQFLREVDAGRVKDVVVTGNRLSGSYVENGTTFQTYSPVIDDSLLDRLQSKNVLVSARPETDGSSGFLSYLGTLLPMLLILGVWLFFMRQMQGGSRGAMGFGKSRPSCSPKRMAA